MPQPGAAFVIKVLPPKEIRIGAVCKPSPHHINIVVTIEIHHADTLNEIEGGIDQMLFPGHSLPVQILPPIDSVTSTDEVLITITVQIMDLHAFGVTAG